MSQPSRSRPTGSGLSALGIANANSAANTFLGVRRPAWIDEESGSPKVRRATLSSASTSASTSSPNAVLNQAGQSTQTKVVNTGSAISAQESASTVQNLSSATMVLPSPAPTKETSPATSFGTESPTVPSSTGTVAFPASVPTDHGAANLHTMPTHLSRRTHATPPLTPSILSPTQPTGPSSTDITQANDLTVRRSSIVRAGSKRDSQTIGTLEHAAKRQHSTPRAPADHTRPTTVHLLASVRMQLASWPNTADQSSKTLRQRYELLERAAATQDWWFLILQCLSSQWHLNKSSFHKDLQTPREVVKGLDQSLEMLDMLLPLSHGIDGRHLRWLAAFPAASVAQLRSITSPLDFAAVIDFLRIFGSQWMDWRTKSSQRGYPLTIDELQQMECTSPVMQTVVMTFLARCLDAPGGLVELLNEQAQDRTFEKRVLEGNISEEDRLTERRSRASRYLEIVLKHSSLYGSRARSPWTEAVFSPTTPGSAGMDGHPGALSQLPSPPPQHSMVQQQAQQRQRRVQQHLQQEQLIAARRLQTEVDQRLQNPWAHQLQQHVRQQSQPQGSHTGPPPATQLQPWRAQLQSAYLESSSSFTSQGATQFREPQGTTGASYTLASNPSAGTLSQHHAATPTYPSMRPHVSSVPSNAFNTVVSPFQTDSPVLHRQRNQSGHNAQESSATLDSVAVPTRSAYTPTTQHRYTQASSSHQNTFRVIPATEYPDNTWNWSSLESGLHLVRHRSPIREPRDSSDTRFYQFVSEYAATATLRPRVGLQTIGFDIREDVLESRVAMHVRHGVERCLYGDGSHRIRLRVCRLPDNTPDFVDNGAAVAATHWPENIYISLNSQHLELRRKQHFRTDWPVEITGLVRQGRNTVVVSLPESRKPRQGSQKYLLTIEIVGISSATSLKGQILEREHFPSEETENILQQRLTGSLDDEIMIQDKHLSISVADPFSSTLCVTPVRSILCKHVECFDLDNWLETRQSKPSKRVGEPSKVDEWKCPICGGDARPHRLRVDEFFVNVRKKLLADGADRTKMIQVDDTGGWTAVLEEDDTDDEGDAEMAPKAHVLAAQRRSTAGAAVIVLDDDD
ncbi:hypothetical protein NLU13_6299 [Sarocladium strictum]|uniref:SP-RING-type domain-containing protein n=1 Tax=Sarocladium strictum TaxID=5046 RepID=A0AA39L6Z7_SARSR|nr:hypothetical protein NLU13_6299 [Sarocladium strictum]